MQTGNYYKFEDRDGQTVNISIDYKAWGKQILIWLLICLIVRARQDYPDACKDENYCHHHSNKFQQHVGLFEQVDSVSVSQ